MHRLVSLSLTAARSSEKGWYSIVFTFVEKLPLWSIKPLVRLSNFDPPKSTHA